MASPLLEAGAIDGARGILINITGSSSLKLSEVNEASTIIQNAAHEDANIIFGAVMDERMGDELKLTVIATGFRDDKPARRERMLSDMTLPAVTHTAPAEPKIVLPQVAAVEPTVAAPTARFASEVAAEQAPTPVLTTPVSGTSAYYEAARQQGRQEAFELSPEPVVAASYVPVVRKPEVVEHLPDPEAGLLPTRASVFDDDFFREPKEPARSVAAPPTIPVGEVPAPVAVHVAEPVLEREEPAEAEPTFWPEARIPSFAGYAGESEAHSESDELDIPAFLRRKN
jgi:cell division protein FtsZ